MGAWNERPDLRQQIRWERMVFVLSVNRFKYLVNNTGSKSKDFLSQVHE